MVKIIKCEVCGNITSHYSKNKCLKCYNHEHLKEKMKNVEYKRKIYAKNYESVKNHPEWRFGYQVCKILEKHYEDLKDDENRLSTDYILKMSQDVDRCGDPMRLWPQYDSETVM